ncbi:MAG: DUF2800 domain-containing protein, partial [Minisyncoccia bacterium]
VPMIQSADRFHVEYHVTSPVHPLFYGTLDFAAIWDCIPSVEVVDLKGGKGIVVDPVENPQMMYYAFGLIEKEDWPDSTAIRLTIAQPRGWQEKPINSWDTTVGYIRKWIADTLVPAMVRAEMDGTLDAGEWCRFCPAKLVCPMLTGLFKAAATVNPDEIVNYSDTAIGLNYNQVQAVKFYIKTLEEEALRRALQGRSVHGCKVVDKKANRVWKDGATDKAVAKFGDTAWTPPKLKTPPQIEELGPEGAKFVREFGYTPHTGYTLAREDDKRIAVKVGQRAKEAFTQALADLDKGS